MESLDKVMSQLLKEIDETLEPLYQSDCSLIEGYLGELPSGSYFQKVKGGYSVKVYQPMSKGGWQIFNEATFAAAYERAMKYIADREKADG